MRARAWFLGERVVFSRGVQHTSHASNPQSCDHEWLTQVTGKGLVAPTSTAYSSRPSQFVAVAMSQSV